MEFIFIYLSDCYSYFIHLKLFFFRTTKVTFFLQNDIHILSFFFTAFFFFQFTSIYY